jgi:hypothetical protein
MCFDLCNTSSPAWTSFRVFQPEFQCLTWSIESFGSLDAPEGVSAGAMQSLDAGSGYFLPAPVLACRE